MPGAGHGNEETDPLPTFELLGEGGMGMFNGAGCGGKAAEYEPQVIFFGFNYCGLPLGRLWVRSYLQLTKLPAMITKCN